MKHVVVTGAASGLGNYLANMFADKGYIVYGLDLDKKKLDEISNKNIIPLLCDITKEAEWDNVLLRKVEEDGQGIDIVIACASIMHIGNAEDCSSEDWESLIREWWLLAEGGIKHNPDYTCDPARLK